MNPYIIIGAIVFWLASLVGAYAKGHSDASTAAQVHQSKDVIAALQVKSDRIIELQNQLQGAYDENAKLRHKNAAAAAAARSAAASLRQQLDSYRTRLRAQPKTPDNQYAATIADLFEQCSVEYQQLAEQADGHAGDVKLLLDAWPK